MKRYLVCDVALRRKDAEDMKHDEEWARAMELLGCIQRAISECPQIMRETEEVYLYLSSLMVAQTTIIEKFGNRIAKSRPAWESATHDEQSEPI